MPRRVATPALVTGLSILAAWALAKYMADPVGAVLAGTIRTMRIEQLPLVLLAAALTPAILWRWPFGGLLLLVATMPIENLVPGAAGVSGFRLLGALLFAVWLLRKLVRGESWESVLNSPLTVAVALFVVWVFASAGWAESARLAVRGAIQLCFLWGLGLVVVDLVRSSGRAVRLAQALVLGGTMAGVLTIQQAMGGASRAGDAIAGGANATASLLLALLPFAFFLLRASRNNGWRLAGLGYVPLAIAAIAVTYSRMNLLLLVPLLGLLSWQTIRGKRGRRLLLGSALVSVVAFSSFVPWWKLRTRVATIPEYVAAATQPKQESSTRQLGELAVYSGRGWHMQIALAIARDHPIIGAGYDSYGALFLEEYQFFVPGAPNMVKTKRSPHSSWWGILADLGAVGIVLWSTVLGVALFFALQVWRRTRPFRQSLEHPLSQAVLVCLLLYALPFGFYFQTQREKVLWVLIGLASAMYGLTKQQRSSQMSTHSVLK